MVSGLLLVRRLRSERLQLGSNPDGPVIRGLTQAAPEADMIREKSFFCVPKRFTNG